MQKVLGLLEAQKYNNCLPWLSVAGITSNGSGAADEKIRRSTIKCDMFLLNLHGQLCRRLPKVIPALNGEQTTCCFDPHKSGTGKHLER